MTDHTTTPWVVEQVEGSGPKIYRGLTDGDAICQLFDKNGESFMHAPGNAAFIVKAVNNHGALVRRLEPFAKLAALFDNYESDIRTPESESVLINVRLADLRDARTLLASVGSVGSSGK